MKILHVVAGVWEGTGGPAEVIPNLCSELVKLGHEVTLVTVEGRHSEAVLLAESIGVKVIAFPNKYISSIRYCTGMFDYIKNNIDSFDVVHNHGHWLYPNWITMLLSKHKNIPLITTPHGTLVPGMLKFSKFKKILSWLIFDRFIIKFANVVHCLSLEEAKLTSLKIGMRLANKIKVIPNGADNRCFEIAESKSRHSVKELKCKLNLPQKKTLLYLSRVSTIKGIEDLLSVWAEKNLDEWQLVIVGDWDDNLVNLKSSIVNDSVHIVGGVYGKKRFEFFELADAFILPSYGEGLPTSLLEACAAKLLVLCSTECNFDLLKDHDGGIFFDAGIPGIRGALESLTSFEPEVKEGIASKGYDLLKDQYSWFAVATKWDNQYKEAVK